MGDVGDDVAQERSSRPGNNRAMERRVTDASGNRQRIAFDRKSVETGDIVDVDQMCRPRHAKRHHRHQALPAGEYAAVVRAQFGELGDCLIDSPWRVITKRRRFHRVGFRQDVRRLIQSARAFLGPRLTMRCGFDDQ